MTPVKSWTTVLQTVKLQSRQDSTGATLKGQKKKKKGKWKKRKTSSACKKKKKTTPSINIQVQSPHGVENIWQSTSEPTGHQFVVSEESESAGTLNDCPGSRQSLFSVNTQRTNYRHYKLEANPSHIDTEELQEHKYLRQVFKSNPVRRSRVGKKTTTTFTYF